MTRTIVLLSVLMLVGASPPQAVTPDDVVLDVAFDSLDKDGHVSATGSDREEPLVGKVYGKHELAQGPGLRLDDNARLRFDAPTMIDLRRGAVSMDVAINYDIETAEDPLGVLWCLQGVGDPNYMARLYLTTRRAQLVFGVYHRDERSWLYLLKTPIHWRPGETHNVTVTWGEKTSLIVDGRITSITRSEGLLTDVMLPSAIDLAEARLFIGPEVTRLFSDFTVSRFEIRNQTFRFAKDAP